MALQLAKFFLLITSISTLKHGPETKLFHFFACFCFVVFSTIVVNKDEYQIKKTI